jgi:hypothetical protein
MAQCLEARKTGLPASIARCSAAHPRYYLFTMSRDCCLQPVVVEGMFPTEKATARMLAVFRRMLSLPVHESRSPANWEARQSEREVKQKSHFPATIPLCFLAARCFYEAGDCVGLLDADIR